MQRDLVIIGAGPAGMAAAAEAATHGLLVTVLDEQMECGGQMYRSIASVSAKRPEDLAILGADYAYGHKLADALLSTNVDYKPHASVWNIEPDDSRVYYSTGGATFSLTAKRILIATGAMERPLPIPGWTLAGVMGAGGAQIVLKSTGMIPDGPVVLVGSGPLLLLTAAQLHSVGANIAAVVETTTWRHYLSGAKGALLALAAPEYLLKGVKMRRALRRAKIPIYTAAHSIEALGNNALQSVRFRTRNTTHSLRATTLLLHEGVIPNTALTRQIGIDHEWCPLQQHWQPTVTAIGGTSINNILVAGDGAGILGARAAEQSGHITALHVAKQLGKIGGSDYRSRVRKHRKVRWRHSTVRPMLDRLFAPSSDIAWSDQAIVCRCYEVTRRTVVEAVRAGGDTPDQVKSLVRCGMGPCQGRMCASTIAGIVAEVREQSVEDVGVYRTRPPIKPITVSELASLTP